jgi:hypothetical protein
MFDAQTVALLESGCSICVATVGADGAPYASRAFGIDVAPERSHVRLLLDADDEGTLANLRRGSPIAVTGVDVTTMRAIQVKGLTDEPERTTAPSDVARANTHIDHLIANIHSLEGTPTGLVERMRPTAFAVCTVAVTEVFDQTPGPVAGSLLRART